MIYSKTKQWTDAFLYAQALVNNGQHKRAAQWIQQAGLLRCYSSYKINRKYNTNQEPSSAALPNLQLESLLLAASSLAVLNDWNAILTLLEDTQLYTTVVETHSAFPITAPLDDEDDIAWQRLAQGMAQVLATETSNKSNPNKVHPLARICSLRGRAYSELGHPLRAATFWKKALYIDPLCIDALEGLLDKSVVQPSQALQIVLNLDYAVQQDDACTGAKDNLEWLRALYLARVHVAAPTGGMVQQGSPAAAALAMSMSMDHNVAQNPQQDDHHDEENEPVDSNTAVLPSLSSAQQQHQPPTNAARHRPSTGGSANVMAGSDPLWQVLLTPIPQQPSVADMSATSSSLFFGNASSIPVRNSLGDTLPENRPTQDSIGDMIRSDAAATAASTPSAEAESALNALWNKHQLQHSPEVLAMAAQQAFYKYDWKNALRYCQELQKIDPLSQNSNKAAFCHVSTLVQLGQKRTLFRLAHKWVESEPKEARSWFAVGAYYYACGRYHV